jgi:hypothetical protein
VSGKVLAIFWRISLASEAVNTIRGQLGAGRLEKHSILVIFSQSVVGRPEAIRRSINQVMKSEDKWKLSLSFPVLNSCCQSDRDPSFLILKFRIPSFPTSWLD